MIFELLLAFDLECSLFEMVLLRLFCSNLEQMAFYKPNSGKV